jgi:hypothetical protein
MLNIYRLISIFSFRESRSHAILLNGSYEYLLARWRFSIELFVKLFLDDVGSEPGSIINQSSGFSAREQRFRHDMERLKNAHQKDIRFQAIKNIFQEFFFSKIFIFCFYLDET